MQYISIWVSIQVLTNDDEVYTFRMAKVFSSSVVCFLKGMVCSCPVFIRMSKLVACSKVDGLLYSYSNLASGHLDTCT